MVVPALPAPRLKKPNLALQKKGRASMLKSGKSKRLEAKGKTNIF